MSRFVAVALALAALAFALAPSASAQVQPYGANDNGYFNNILPPGENGFDNALQLAQYEANKTYPPHNNDQLQMYSNLTTAAPNIQESQLGQFYKDATFGVPAGDVAGSESPEPGVTIVRDASFGVPHIYGDTRAELMFGIGYATAEDRLFFIDVLRHAGDGTLAQFAGGQQRVDGRERVGERAVHRAGPAEPGQRAAGLPGRFDDLLATSPTTSRGSTRTSRRPRPTRC